MDRRRFIQCAGSAAAATWLVPFAQAAGRPVAGKPIALGRFEDVDTFEHTHALRDGRAPATPEPDEHCDLVIVGGGLSGLASAWRLRRHKIVVLEKEPSMGGNSRSGELAGCRYSIGAFLSQGPIAPFTGFFDEIGADFIRLAPGDHALAVAGRLVRDPLGAGLARLPWPDADRTALRAAVTRLKVYLDAKEGISFPMAANTPAIRALDTRTQWEQYEREALPARVRELFDVLLGARIADNGEHLSAWYGSFLLSSLLADTYTMRGGHGDFSRRLAEKLHGEQPQALRTGFTVLRVENRGSEEVHVSGLDSQGRPKSIAARCAVVGTPKHFAKHLVPGLRAARAEAYASFRYNAYLVAQVSLRRRVALPFETTAPKAKLAKFIVAPDALPGNARRDGGGLLTVYAPFARVAGRAELLGAQAQDLAQRIAADLRGAVPEAAGAIDGIVLQRWGHPMLTAPPRMGPALEAAQQPEGRIAFAHSDKLGLTGLYSALWAGMEAEADAELILT